VRRDRVEERGVRQWEKSERREESERRERREGEERETVR